MRQGHGLMFVFSLMCVVAMSVVVVLPSSAAQTISIPATDLYPVWSPDGTRIAFESDRAGNSDIFVMDGIGGDLVNVTNHSSRDRSVAWSPDGSKLVFESNRDGRGDIFVMNPDGSNLINLTKSDSQNIQPSWSPDGSKIVFSSSRLDGVVQNIFVMDADGSNQTLLYENPTAVYEPVFSPDGNTIAFMGSSQLFLMNAIDGSNVVQLTTRDVHGNAQRPVWSPDGTKLAFQSSKSGSWDIYVMNLDGSDLVNLTNDNNVNTAPTWSPDGKWIAFVSKRQDHSNIFALKADGSSPEPVRLSEPDYVHVKTWGSRSLPEDPMTYGADANPTGDPVGGGVGYRNVVTEGDYEVASREQLLQALEGASPGQVIYIVPHAEIDLTGIKDLRIPFGVTLAGNRGVDGSPGPLLYTTNWSDQHFSLLRPGENVRITGIRLRGPEGGTQENEFSPEATAGLHRTHLAAGYIWSLPTSRGISTGGKNVEIDNNEIYNWTHAGIYVEEDGAYIHHNSIHHVQRRALGYPIQVGAATALIEANYFDYYRHAIAATGKPGSGYEARYNLVGPNATEFAFDIHGGRDFCKSDPSQCTDVELYMGGEYIHIHHNTFMNTQQRAIGIRGVPLEGGRVYRNRFYHNADDLTTPFPVIFYGYVGNTEISDNIYGPDRRLVGLESERSPLVRRCSGSCKLEDSDGYEIIDVVDPLRVGFLQPESDSRPSFVTGTIDVEVEVELGSYLDVDRVIIRMDDEIVYSEKSVPKPGWVRFNTLSLNDGLHTLTLEVFYSEQDSIEAKRPLYISNWWEINDTFEPPKMMDWFGEVDFSKTSDTSEGWTYATGDEDVFFGDDTRRVKLADTTEYLVWDSEKLRDFTAVMYFKGIGLDEEDVRNGVIFEAWEDDRSRWSLPYNLEFETSSTDWVKVVATGVVPERTNSSKFRITVEEHILANEFALGAVTLKGNKGS